MNTSLLTVSLKGPKKELFNGRAVSISSVNKKGKFDILPYHINFITLIKEYVTIRDENNKELTFPLENGVLKVTEDKVKILIGI